MEVGRKGKKRREEGRERGKQKRRNVAKKNSSVRQEGKQKKKNDEAGGRWKLEREKMATTPKKIFAVCWRRSQKKK